MTNPTPIIECSRCGYQSAWTDGRTIAADDERNEFWCQICGHENPLPDKVREADQIAAAFTAGTTRWHRAADGRYCTTPDCEDTTKHLSSYSKTKLNRHLDVYAVARLNVGLPFVDVEYVGAEATR